MRNQRTALLMSILTAIGVLAIGESGARMLERRIPSAGDWPRGPISEQADAVSRDAHGSAVSVVFAGSSMVEAGIDASRFTRLTGVKSLNVALPASTNFMVEPWIVHVVVPALRPKVVVIGVASRDFNDNGSGPADALKALTQAPGYRRAASHGLFTSVDRAVSRFSALVRLRRELRVPTNVLRALRTTEPATVTRCSSQRTVARPYRSSALVSTYPVTVLKKYSAGGVQTRALIRTIRDLKRLGTEVVLMKLPATSEYLSLHPHGRADIVSFEDALGRVTHETNVPLIDGSSISNKRFFRDQIHLNCSGAERLTTAIASKWPASLALRPPSTGPRAAGGKK